MPAFWLMVAAVTMLTGISSSPVYLDVRWKRRGGYRGAQGFLPALVKPAAPPLVVPLVVRASGGLGFVPRLSNRFGQEEVKRSSTRITIQCVGRLFEFDPLE